MSSQHSSNTGHSTGSSHHHRHHRRVSPVLVAVIVVLTFSFVTAGSAFAFTTLINQGRINLQGLVGAEVDVVEEAETVDNGKTVVYKGQEYRLNENMISLCLIGHDKDEATPAEGFNGQADAVVVLAIDSETGKMTGIVVPRDSMVDINVNYFETDELYQTENMQLCLAYAYGTDDDSSSKLVCTAVSRILYNIPVDYYYTMSMSGAVALADTVGGVAVDALETIPNSNIVEGETVKLEGYTAERYLRYRDTSQYGSDLDRQARQMQFVKAVVTKALTVAQGNPSALVAIYNTLSNFATTNIGLSEATYLATIVANGVGSFDLVSLDGEPVHNDNSQWEQFILDRESVYETVLDVYYTKVGPVANSESGASAS